MSPRFTSCATLTLERLEGRDLPSVSFATNANANLAKPSRLPDREFTGWTESLALENLKRRSRYVRKQPENEQTEQLSKLQNLQKKPTEWSF